MNQQDYQPDRKDHFLQNWKLEQGWHFKTQTSTTQLAEWTNSYWWCQLRSAAAKTCIVPRTHNNFGDAASLQQAHACGTGCRCIYDRTRTTHVSSANWKHLCLWTSQPRRIVTIAFMRHRSTLTYLLTYLLIYDCYKKLSYHWQSVRMTRTSNSTQMTFSLKVTQGHRKCHGWIECIRFPITVL